MTIQDPKFSIGDTVYHVTPESPKGIVLDVIYSFRTNLFDYVVTFSAERESLIYSEHELSNHKTFS